jgi:hypothetical protein
MKFSLASRVSAGATPSSAFEKVEIPLSTPSPLSSPTISHVTLSLFALVTSHLRRNVAVSPADNIQSALEANVIVFVGDVFAATLVESKVTVVNFVQFLYIARFAIEGDVDVTIFADNFHKSTLPPFQFVTVNL